MYNLQINNTEIKSTSDYLNRLVLAYREGLPNSAEALIEAFEPIISKYQALLLADHWNTADKDLQLFLKMLGGPNPQRTATNLYNSLARAVEPEDIRQELVLAVLETANKYLNIASTYRFAVKARIEMLLKDSFVFDRMNNEPNLDDIHAFIDLGAIDKSWVRGTTAGDGWDQLTETQRAIIKYLYHDGLAEAAAAKKLKMSVRQLQRLNQGSKKTLAEHFST